MRQGAPLGGSTEGAAPDHPPEPRKQIDAAGWHLGSELLGDLHSLRLGLATRGRLAEWESPRLLLCPVTSAVVALVRWG